MLAKVVHVTAHGQRITLCRAMQLFLHEHLRQGLSLLRLRTHARGGIVSEEEGEDVFEFFDAPYFHAKVLGLVQEIIGRKRLRPLIHRIPIRVQRHTGGRRRWHHYTRWRNAAAIVLSRTPLSSRAVLFFVTHKRYTARRNDVCHAAREKVFYAGAQLGDLRRKCARLCLIQAIQVKHKLGKCSAKGHFPLPLRLRLLLLALIPLFAAHARGPINPRGGRVRW